MNCERIQEILITDYVDGKLNSEIKKIIDEHLSSCAECREFLAAVDQSSVKPLSNLSKVEFSREKVWQNIQKQIEQSHQPAEQNNFLISLWQSLFSRPAWVVSLAVVVVLAGVYFSNVNREATLVQQEVVEQEEQFLVSVADNFSSSADDEDNYGTDIEEYFL